ncbi:MAG: pentapeptide repeat-containing protein [Anaerolineae bacterium]|nr:pentapeptide repeat-containing protein [Anaerolineae bacterium]
MRRKRQLIKLMGSTVNAQAINAVAELNERGWLLTPALEYANLTEANLQGAHLGFDTHFEASSRYHNLRHVKLNNANLAGAFLHHVDLSYADLSGADLYMANLAGARLVGADLRGANLHLANLAGAQLIGCNILARAVVAIFDTSTRLPDGKPFDDIAENDPKKEQSPTENPASANQKQASCKKPTLESEPSLKMAVFQLEMDLERATSKGEEARIRRKIQVCLRNQQVFLRSNKKYLATYLKMMCRQLEPFIGRVKTAKDKSANEQNRDQTERQSRELQRMTYAPSRSVPYYTSDFLRLPAYERRQCQELPDSNRPEDHVSAEFLINWDRVTVKKWLLQLEFAKKLSTINPSHCNQICDYVYQDIKLAATGTNQEEPMEQKKPTKNHPKGEAFIQDEQWEQLESILSKHHHSAQIPDESMSDFITEVREFLSGVDQRLEKAARNHPHNDHE